MGLNMTNEQGYDLNEPLIMNQWTWLWLRYKMTYGLNKALNPRYMFYCIEPWLYR